MSNTNKDRKQESLEVRVSAAQLAAGRVHPAHVSNNDETKFRNSKGEPTYLASFTKGMPHNETTGLVDIEKVGVVFEFVVQYDRGLNSHFG